MRLTDRVLPPEEWHRLKGTGLDAWVDRVDPTAATVAVVETEDGVIVGCWAAVQMLHVEGLWIAPAYRGHVSAARRLWRRMRAIVMGKGAASVVTASMSPEITAMLATKQAQPMPPEYILCLQ